MKKLAAGFTLIELIIVIVIIGVLAAIAVPRFINQTGNARIAALNGLAGAINSAISLAQAEYRAEGNSSASSATGITMDGQSVAVIAGTGRPAPSAAGITSALQTLSGFTPTYTSPSVQFDFSTAIANCFVTYNANTGAVTVTSSGC